MKTSFLTGLGILIADGALAQSNALREVDPFYPELEKLYIDFHANPELSFQEVRTSARSRKACGGLGVRTRRHSGPAVQPRRGRAARIGRSPRRGAALPSLHSSEWAPDRSITLRLGAASLTVAAMELLGKP